MFKKILLVLVLLKLTIIAYSQELLDSDSKNDHFRAMWIVNIANNVVWPNEDTIKIYKIVIFSFNQGVYNNLVTLSQTEKIKGKPFTIQLYNKLKGIPYSQVFYLGFDKNPDIFRINKMLENTSTLLITDRLDDKDNIMVNLLPFEVGDKRIEIDKMNMEKHNLSVTDQLIYHGGSDDELKDLVSKQRKVLDQQIQDMQKKKTEIEDLQKELDNQTKLLKEQQVLVQMQKQQLQQLSATLEQQKLELAGNEEALQKQEELIKIKQLELSNQVEEMKKKEYILTEKNEEIKVKQDELKDLETQISDSKKALTTANQQIQMQQTILKIVAVFLAIILIISLFLWQALRKNNRMNKELRAKNAEILNQKEKIELQAKLLENTNKELEKLSLVAENAQNGVIIMNNKGEIEWVNAGFTKMYGYTLQLFVDEKDKNILHASSNIEIEKIVDRCLNEKVPVTYEAETEKRNKEKLWVKTTLTPILNANDEIDKIVAIDTDISELKKAYDEITNQHTKIAIQAEELKSKNIELQKLSVVVSETDNAVLITDNLGNIEWVNPAFERTFGYTLDEFTSNKSKNIVSQTTPQYIIDEIEKLYRHKGTVSYQFKTNSKENKPIWVQATLTPILNENKEIEKIIVVDSDITAIKEAERLILEKNQELIAQKEKIEEQNLKINSSIKYAQTIQNSILPIKNVTDKYFDSEIIYLPKDVVSGDFYWFYSIDELNTWYAATVDCTGHGVPGAFMSLISSRILNEIVMQNHNITPDEILNQTEVKITNALMQDHTNNKDGLDISICKVIKKENKFLIEFAGAKRNAYIYNKNNNNIVTLEGNRSSIGGLRKKDIGYKYDKKQTIADKGDIIYMLTDGFIDQNNFNRKKFGSEKLLNKITEIKDKDIKTQKDYLLSEYKNHILNTEQRDDITLWIIKV